MQCFTLPNTHTTIYVLPLIKKKKRISFTFLLPLQSIMDSSAYDKNSETKFSFKHFLQTDQRPINKNNNEIRIQILIQQKI